MNKYLRIENAGEIDPNAFLLIGASTKTNDTSKIGEFGSGANYAIAWLLRNKVDFAVYSGENKISFDVRDEIFRGETFGKIYVNGEPTSFTVSMGKDWQPWFVLREFWCNALDEGEAVREILNVNTEDLPEDGRVDPDHYGKAGKTRIYIELRPELLEIVDDWSTYFSEGRKDLVWECPDTGAKIFSGGDELIVYRKGIRVYYSRETPCVFHYDLPNLKINESRTISETWTMNWEIRNYLGTKVPRDVVRQLLRKIKNRYEADIHWNYQSTLSEGFKEVLEGKTVVEESLQDHYGSLAEINKSVVLPDALAKKLVAGNYAEHVAGDMSNDGVVIIEPTEKELSILKSAADWLRSTGYEIEAEIRLARFSRKGILGLAHVKTIFVSREACESVRLCASTIIEEQEHLRTGFADCTRSLQDHLIELLISEKEKAYNSPIQ